ncbi:MAG: M28 family peptidase [Planctomycetes bacterium]|nr:M28 family peptidase [Planctomycetota bacterium]
MQLRRQAMANRLTMTWLGLALLFSAGLAGRSLTAGDDPAVARMKRDITFLASPECEGRGPGTKGIDKAADYIVEQFKQAGLKPGGINGTFLQPFTVSGGAELVQPGQLVLHGPQGMQIELKADSDFQVMGLSDSGIVNGPLVFAGYGITRKPAPGKDDKKGKDKKDTDISYDDFQGIDLKGKIAVILRHTPRWTSKDAGFPKRDEHAGLEKKQALAEINNAAAVLFVNDSTEAAAGDNLMPFSYLVNASPGKIPAFQIRRSVLDRITQSSLGKPLADIESAIDRDLKPMSAALPGWKASMQVQVLRKTIPVKNVIAVAEGFGPLAKETVVVGAHYDHLGYGGRGSRAGNAGKKEIHHGADDNASGTTSVLELARRIAQMRDRAGRRIVFITFSAEEMGLLGSRHYCNKEPLFPLKDTVAMVNLDMVGRMSEDPKTKKSKLIVEGLGTSKGFESLIDKLNAAAGLQISKKKGGTGPSDHDSFYRKDIPVFFFWTGMHKDYHKPSDTAEKINVPGMKRVADMAEKVILTLATAPDRPQYVKVASDFTTSPGGKIPRLGITPNYEEEKVGVLVGGVADKGPAAKAGIKAGDLIVEIAGKSVSNLNTYMVILGQQARGQPVAVGVMRDGKKLTLKVIPQ